MRGTHQAFLQCQCISLLSSVAIERSFRRFQDYFQPKTFENPSPTFMMVSASSYTADTIINSTNEYNETYTAAACFSGMNTPTIQRESQAKISPQNNGIKAARV